MHMSKAGIYDQLTSEHGEKFSAEGQHNMQLIILNADYNENALAKAKVIKKICLCLLMQ